MQENNSYEDLILDTMQKLQHLANYKNWALSGLLVIFTRESHRVSFNGTTNTEHYNLLELDVNHGDLH